jgi:TetR/AcrR family transcriptional regulator
LAKLVPEQGKRWTIFANDDQVESMTAASKGRERDTVATRRSILDAAEELFSSKGYADTAMSQIARQSGVTKSLIHHHFGSKAALWDEVRGRLKSEYLGSQAQTLDDAGELPPAELLAQAITNYFRFLQSRPHVVRMMSWSLLDPDPTHRWLDHTLNERMMGIAQRAQANGSVRADIEPVCLLIITSSMVEHYFESKAEFNELIGPEQAAKLDDTYLQNVLTVLQHGVIAS